MHEILWKGPVQSVVSGTCVLVLGPDIPVASAPGTPDAPKSVRDAFSEYLVSAIESVGSIVPESTMFAVAQQFESPFEKSLNAVCGRDSSLGCGPQQRAAEWPRSRRRPNGIRAT